MNALNLLHPLQFSKENEALAKQAMRDYKLNNPQQTKSLLLSKEMIVKAPEHKWLAKCETILVNLNEHLFHEDFVSDFVTQLEAEAKKYVKDEVGLQDSRPVIALDLETTSLNKTVKRVGGANVSYNDIVGICLAVSDCKGYYIPVKHNGKDNLDNLEPSATKLLLQALVDRFFIVYHNAVFDQEVMAQYGINFNSKNEFDVESSKIVIKKAPFADTMILAILAGYRVTYRQVGLKFLSDKLLGRKMLEIHELLGTKNKDVNLQDIPASNAYVYGCSDAMNTWALFDYFMKKDNSFLSQKNPTSLCHRMVDVTRSLYRFGLPVDYNGVRLATKTMLRRIIIFESIFYSVVGDDVSIKSAEQVGTYIYNLLKTAWEKKYNKGKSLTPDDRGFALLSARLADDFGMTVKVKELKAGVKVVADSSDNTLSNIYDNLESWDFVTEKTANDIYLIIECIQDYRSLLHELIIFYKMMRFCYNDDLNICRTGIGLKLMGADTLRYSNQSGRGGSFDNLEIVEMKTKTKLEINKGDGITGFNAQGLSNKSGKTIKLKKVLNFTELSPEINQVKAKLDKAVEASFQDLLKTGSYQEQ